MDELTIWMVGGLALIVSLSGVYYAAETRRAADKRFETFSHELVKLLEAERHKIDDTITSLQKRVHDVEIAARTASKKTYEGLAEFREEASTLRTQILELDRRVHTRMVAKKP